MTGKRQGASGMSMIEILIGLFILGLVIIPSFNVILSDTRSVKATRDHVSAAFLAQKMFETARSFKFELLDSEQYSSEPDKQKKTLEWILKNDTNMNQQKINGILYKITNVNIEPVKNKNAVDDPWFLVLFSFAIEYQSPDGRSHRLDLATGIAQEE